MKKLYTIFSKDLDQFQVSHEDWQKVMNETMWNAPLVGLTQSQIDKLKQYALH